jgi:SAM-dependent methyltransferase
MNRLCRPEYRHAELFSDELADFVNILRPGVAAMHKETSSVPAIKRIIRGIKGIPVVGTTASKLARLPVFSPARRLAFPGSAEFWDARYREGGTSGKGSYGKLAEFKAEILNDFVRAKHISSVIELGCGDGAQLSLAEYPEYVGVDVSEISVQRCRALFADDKTKRFYLKSALPADLKTFDLAISLDVIYHLVEDDVFDAHMRELFHRSNRHVVIYASNYDESMTEGAHVRHRKFTKWVAENAKNWNASQVIANRYPFDASRPEETSFADFHFFEHQPL